MSNLVKEEIWWRIHTIKFMLVQERDYEIQIETIGSKPGMEINHGNLKRELRKSEVGKDTLRLLKEYHVKVVLNYERPIGLNRFVRGFAEEGNFRTLDKLLYGGRVTINVWNTQSVKETTKDIIHETTHTIGHGPGGRFLAPSTIKSEVWARLRAAAHIQPITKAEIRKTIKWVKERYWWLSDWR